MICYQEALKSIQSNASKFRKSEWINFENSVGRISFKEIMSPENIPSFTNSSMDGFAIHFSETNNATASNPVVLRVVDCVIAGDTIKSAGGLGECHEIMTGAPLPIGYDAVIKVEEVKKFSRDGNTYIQIEKNLNYFENVRNEGGDFKKGNVVLKKNEKITEAHLMAMASLGITSVEVYARPKVVLISTGNELVEPGSIVTPGKIRNSTGVYLTAVLRKLGCDVEYCGIIADETKYFFEKIKEILKNPPDIIISTGAVSMGKYDFITSAIKDLGADIYFHKVAIRPGKPLLFAKFPNEKTMFFGLPGNPVSSSVGIRFFIVPFLRESFGIKSEKPIRAKLINHFKKPEGLRCFFKSKLSLSKQENPEVEILEGQASFIVQSLTKANAWVVLEESGSAVSMGDWLDVYPLLLMTDDWTEALDDTSQAFNAKGCC